MYLRIFSGGSVKQQKALKHEILTAKAELLQTSAQDQFATWAKLRRRVDKGLADLEKLSESLRLPPPSPRLLRPSNRRGARYHSKRLRREIQCVHVDYHNWTSVRHRVVVSQGCRLLPPARMVWSRYMVAGPSVRTRRYGPSPFHYWRMLMTSEHCRLCELRGMADGVQASDKSWRKSRERPNQ